MLQKVKILALFTSVCTILSQTVPVAAKPAASTQNQNPQPTTETIYQKAKKELPEDVYVVYRVVDRIARANGIDDHPWRIGVVQEYNINAFATETNLVAVYSGLLDQLGGDASALACVIGHEMGHHTERHLALGPTQELALREQIQKEAEEQVKQEIESANSEATGASVSGAVARGIGSIFGGWGNVAGNVAGSAADSAAQQRMATAEKRVQEIVAQKTAELEEKIAQQSRQHEFEADEKGYIYIATAGFDPQGCVRMLEVLGRMPGSEKDSTHPAVAKRIERMQQLMTERPATTLVPLGESRIKTTQPLTFDPSKDGQSLRINSRHGGNGGDFFEQQFGQ